MAHNTWNYCQKDFNNGRTNSLIHFIFIFAMSRKNQCSGAEENGPRKD